MALFSWRKKKQHVDGNPEGEMSFLDHLEELRWHLVRSIVGILLFAIVLFTFRVEIIGEVFMSPFREDFVTYRFLCEHFDQFCESDAEAPVLVPEIPDSTAPLQVEGFILEETIVPRDSVWVLVDPVLYPDSLVRMAPPPDTLRKKKPIQLELEVAELLRNGQLSGFKVQTKGGQMVEIQAISPYEQFMKALLYAFLGGLILAFPYVTWELWRFIRPALNPREARKVRWNVFFTSLLFFTGVAFGYFIILPFSVQFLSSFVLFNEAQNIWRIGDVVNFVLLLLFGTGFIFQLPVVVYYMSIIGFVTPRFLKKYRKHAIVVLLVLAAILTPPDPMSQILIFFPLLGLYEMGIGISRRVEKRQAAERAKEEEEDRIRREALRKQDEREKEKERAQQEAEQKKQAETSGKEEESLPENLNENSPEEKSPSDENEDDDDDDDGPDLSPPEGIVSRD